MTNLTDQVTHELNRLRNPHLAIDRSKPPLNTATTAHAFDYLHARSTLHRLVTHLHHPSAISSSHAQPPIKPSSNLSHSIINRIRRLSHPNLPPSTHPTTTTTNPRPKPPASSVPKPTPSSSAITHFALTHPSAHQAAASVPPPTNNRSKSPLRAPNKFYNVRLSQTPIFLRRTSIKPPHLTSLPIPAPPLAAPYMTQPPVKRKQSPVRRKPADLQPSNIPIIATVRPRALHTSSVALQTQSTPRKHPTANASIAVQVDSFDSGFKVMGTMTDYAHLVDRASSCSPRFARSVACQADLARFVLNHAVSSQTDPAQLVYSRPVTTDTRGLIRVLEKAVQSDPEPAAPVVLPALVNDHSGLRFQVQALVRLASESVLHDAVSGMVLDMIHRTVTRWPVSCGIQTQQGARYHADASVQCAPNQVNCSTYVVTNQVDCGTHIVPNQVDCGTHITPIPSPPQLLVLVLKNESIQTTSVSPPKRESPDPLPHPHKPPTMVDESIQMSSMLATSIPSLSPVVEPVLPSPPKPIVQSVAVQSTPSPPPEHLHPTVVSLPTTELMTATIPDTPASQHTSQDSLPPPSSIASAKSQSPGLVPECSTTTIHTDSVSMSMELSEGEVVVTGIYSEGECLDFSNIAPMRRGMRVVSADTSIENEKHHLVVHRAGELKHALDFVSVEKEARERTRRKRHALERLRLRGLGSQMAAVVPNQTCPSQYSIASSSGISLPSSPSGVSVSVGEIGICDQGDLTHLSSAADGAHSIGQLDLSVSVDEPKYPFHSSITRPCVSEPSDGEIT